MDFGESHSGMNKLSVEMGKAVGRILGEHQLNFGHVKLINIFEIQMEIASRQFDIEAWNLG